MGNQIESGCQGRVLQFIRHHWRLFFTETIDAYEVKDIMILGVPNSFIQTNMPPKKDGEERVRIKIIGILVYMLFKLDSDTYRKNVVV